MYHRTYTKLEYLLCYRKNSFKYSISVIMYALTLLHLNTVDLTFLHNKAGAVAPALLCIV